MYNCEKYKAFLDGARQGRLLITELLSSSNHSKQLWRNAVNCALKYTLYLSIYRNYY